MNVKIKVKQSHYGLGEARRVPGGWGSKISRESAHEGGNVSLTHRPPLLPRRYPCYSFLLEAESTPARPKGLCQWKFPMTPSGIEPATFRLVAQCLNQLRHLVSQCMNVKLGMDCVWDVEGWIFPVASNGGVGEERSALCAEITQFWGVAGVSSAGWDVRQVMKWRWGR